MSYLEVLNERLFLWLSNGIKTIVVNHHYTELIAKMLMVSPLPRSPLQYYWADLAQTCSLGPLAMSRILSLRLIHAMHALTSPYLFIFYLIFCYLRSSNNAP